MYKTSRSKLASQALSWTQHLEFLEDTATLWCVLRKQDKILKYVQWCENPTFSVHSTVRKSWNSSRPNEMQSIWPNDPEPGVCGFKHLRVRANALSILLVLPGFWRGCVAGEYHLLSTMPHTPPHKAWSVAFAPSPANDVKDMTTPQTNTKPNGPTAFVCHLWPVFFVVLTSDL